MRTLDRDGRRWAFLLTGVGILILALCSNLVSYAGVLAQDISPAPGTPTTTSSVVSSASDDAGTDPVGCASESWYDEIYFGQCNDRRDITSGFVFRAVAVPQGAHIEDAYIDFTVDGTYANTLDLAVYGEAVGNANPFGAYQPARRPHSHSGPRVLVDQAGRCLGDERKPADSRTNRSRARNRKSQ